MEIQVGEYISRKEYLKKNDSNVGYALHVQKSIKKDDYARLNTGEIVKVIGIKENNVNKKAIYYGIYEHDWFDSGAVENFSEGIIDLVEAGDYVNGHLIDYILEENENRKEKILRSNRPYRENGTEYKDLIEKGSHFNMILHIRAEDIRTIVTKEQFESVEYKVGEE